MAPARRHKKIFEFIDKRGFFLQIFTNIFPFMKHNFHRVVWILHWFGQNDPSSPPFRGGFALASGAAARNIRLRQT